MKIVSSQTDEERQQALQEKERLEREQRIERARWDVEHALVVLTANLLRVVRGAGRSYSITTEMVECLRALQAYREAAGVGLSGYDFEQMLSVRSDRETAHRDGFDVMMRGGLQIAASRLLEQTTQERAGESELLDGVKQQERYWEEQRRKWSSLPTSPPRAVKAKPPPPKNAANGPQQAKTKAKATKAKAKPKKSRAPTGHKAILAAYKAARGIE